MIGRDIPADRRRGLRWEALWGEITFEGNIEPFMPLIKAGEVLHIGKGTGFGLGRYRIV